MKWVRERDRRETWKRLGKIERWSIKKDRKKQRKTEREGSKDRRTEVKHPLIVLEEAAFAALPTSLSPSVLSLSPSVPSLLHYISLLPFSLVLVAIYILHSIPFHLSHSSSTSTFLPHILSVCISGLLTRSVSLSLTPLPFSVYVQPPSCFLSASHPFSILSHCHFVYIATSLTQSPYLLPSLPGFLDFFSPSLPLALSRRLSVIAEGSLLYFSLTISESVCI